MKRKEDLENSGSVLPIENECINGEYIPIPADWEEDYYLCDGEDPYNIDMPDTLEDFWKMYKDDPNFANYVRFYLFEESFKDAGIPFPQKWRDLMNKLDAE